MKKIAYHGGRFGNTFWFSSSPRVAGSYGKITWINQIPQFDDYETYEIELKNPFVVNAKEAYYLDIKTPTKMKNDWISSTVNTDGIVEWAKNNGYDSVIIKNVIEGHGCSDVADEYVLFNRNFKEIERITEGLEELTDDVYATNSAYDVINFMKNKPKAVRIVWDSEVNYYFLGDAFNYIHEDIMEEAFYQGFYPDLIDSTEARDKVENFDVTLFAFYPTQNHKQDVEKSGDGYTRKYTYDFGTIYAHEVTPFEDCPLYQILGEPISKESIFEDIDFKSLNVLVESILLKDKLYEMSIHDSKLSFPAFYNFCINKNQKKKQLSKMKDRVKKQQLLNKIIKEDKYFKNISGKLYNNVWITENSIEHVKNEHPEITSSEWETFLTIFNPNKDAETPSTKLKDGGQKYIYKCTDGRNYYGYVLIKFPRAATQLLTMFCDKEANIDNWIKIK